MKSFFTIIIAIVLFVAAVSGIIFYTQLKQQKSELCSIKERIELIIDQVSQTKEKIADLKKQNKSFQQQILEAQNKMSGYKSQISNLKSENSQFFSKLHQKRISLNALKEKLDRLTAERDDLASSLNQAILRRQHANEEMKKIKLAKRQLEEDIKKYIKPEKGVELERIVVKLSEVSDGTILEINKEYGFAIIDAGANDGIIVGDILGVYRDNELVSKVVVEKVFEGFSSVVPAEGFTDVELKVSDAVSLIR